MSCIKFFKINILQIDALHDGHGWFYNNWFSLSERTIGDDILNSNRKLLRYLRDQEFLSDASKGQLSVYNDGYNIEIRIKSNQKPIYALCYGQYL